MAGESHIHLDNRFNTILVNSCRKHLGNFLLSVTEMHEYWRTKWMQGKNYYVVLKVQKYLVPCGIL